jgi:hypothetical protein
MIMWQRETAAGKLKKNICRYSTDTRNTQEIKGLARFGRLCFIVHGCPNE